MENYSVLMSLYSKEKPDYLINSVDSMINQTVKPDEIIIVKDGPLTDELDSIVSKYKKLYPSLFTIISNQENIGLGLSLNQGLKIARNELIARMDTDDISKPYRCEKQLRVFEKDRELSLISSWVDEYDDVKNVVLSTRKVPETNDEIYKFAKRRSAFNHPAVMYKKSAVLSCGGYSNLRRNQDVDLFGRMLFSGFKAYNIQEPLLLFRTNIDLAKRRKSWQNTKSYIQTIKKLWKIGYSSFWDYFIVAFAQICVFLLPSRLQVWAYNRFLRK